MDGERLIDLAKSIDMANLLNDAWHTSPHHHHRCDATSRWQQFYYLYTSEGKEIWWNFTLYSSSCRCASLSCGHLLLHILQYKSTTKLKSHIYCSIPWTSALAISYHIWTLAYWPWFRKISQMYASAIYAALLHINQHIHTKWNSACYLKACHKSCLIVFWAV